MRLRLSKIRPCSNTQQPPEITVADSDHLLIDWTKSFDGFKSSQVLIAFVQFQRSNVLKVSFTANKASVRANPCLAKREISVRLTYKEPIQGPTNVVTREIRSLSANYNEFDVNLKIEELYSGLLKKSIIEKICDKSASHFDLSDVPKEIRKCFKASIVKRTEDAIHCGLKIVDFRGGGKIKVVEATFNTSETCGQDSHETEVINKSEQHSSWLIPTLISTLIIIVLIILAGCLLCSGNRSNKMMREDFNVNYDTSRVDYEYGDTTNQDYDYDTMDDESSPGRDIKMEVVNSHRPLHHHQS